MLLKCTFCPVGIEPVNDIFAISGLSHNNCPVKPSPWMMFITPGGAPASVMASANNTDVNGVNCDGLYTMVLPHARAGAIFQEAVCTG